MSTQTIAESWLFESSSSAKTYETLRYADGSLSCNCPGWTRRTTASGERSCKHTRLAECGLADREAKNHRDYNAYFARAADPIPAVKNPPVPAFPMPTYTRPRHRRVL